MNRSNESLRNKFEVKCFIGELSECAEEHQREQRSAERRGDTHMTSYHAQIYEVYRVGIQVLEEKNLGRLGKSKLKKIVADEIFKGDGFKLDRFGDEHFTGAFDRCSAYFEKQRNNTPAVAADSSPAGGAAKRPRGRRSSKDPAQARLIT